MILNNGLRKSLLRNSGGHMYKNYKYIKIAPQTPRNKRTKDVIPFNTLQKALTHINFIRYEILETTVDNAGNITGFLVREREDK